MRQGYHPPSFTDVETEAQESCVIHPRYHGQEVREPELRCGEDAGRGGPRPGCGVWMTHLSRLPGGASVLQSLQQQHPLQQRIQQPQRRPLAGPPGPPGARARPPLQGWLQRQWHRHHPLHLQPQLRVPGQGASAGQASQAPGKHGPLWGRTGGRRAVPPRRQTAGGLAGACNCWPDQGLPPEVVLLRLQHPNGPGRGEPRPAQAA